MNEHEKKQRTGFLTEKLRWLLFLPAAVGGMMLTYTVVAVLRRSAGEAWSESYGAQVLIGLFGSFFSAVLFVNIGAALAPRRKAVIARILALTFLLMTTARLYDMWRWRPESDPLWIPAAAAALTGIAGAFFSAFFYQQREEVFQIESHKENDPSGSFPQN